MRLRAAVLACALAAGTKARSAGPEPPLATLAPRTVPAGPLGPALAPALALAAARLGTEACRAILEELPDFTGRPAARRLEAAHRSASAHFSRLRFVADAGDRCAGGALAAWSSPGDVHVHLCPREFAAVAARDRREAAAILIHEALHTLGIAEDAAKEPLTPWVRRRCGL